MLDGHQTLLGKLVWLNPLLTETQLIVHHPSRFVEYEDCDAKWLIPLGAAHWAQVPKWVVYEMKATQWNEACLIMHPEVYQCAKAQIDQTVERAERNIDKMFFYGSRREPFNPPMTTTIDQHPEIKYPGMFSYGMLPYQGVIHR